MEQSSLFGVTAMSDKDKIMKHFKTHKYITCMQAIHKLGVYNLRSRMSEIPHKKDMIEVVRDDGVMTRVARYWL